MNILSKHYACLCRSYYEDERSSLGFLSFPEFDAVNTDLERYEIFVRLQKEKKLGIMAAAEFYDLQVKDKQKAIVEYQKVISEHGKEGLPIGIYQAPFTVESFSRIRIATCYQSLGQYDKAVEYYQFGYPWMPFHFEIAECYRLKGEVESAEKNYAECITYNLADQWASNPTMALRAALIIGSDEKAIQAIKAIKRRYARNACELELMHVSECIKDKVELVKLVQQMVKRLGREKEAPD